MNYMKIGEKEVGPGHPSWICAEIGINHSGSLEIAKKLIDAASLAGADAVKFQKRSVDVVYTKEELEKPRESPFGSTNGDLKRGLEFGFKEYGEISAYCLEKKIDWFASPWDVASVDFLEQFDVIVYKVASACITDMVLLKRIAQTKKPVILSTGMSTIDQVKQAASFFPDVRHSALLVTTSTYPAKLEELNLSRIRTLNRLFPYHIVGYSNHHPGLWVNLCAVAMGAHILEFHLTLDRASFGSDQSASIEPNGAIKLISEIRDFEKATGDGKIGMLESERMIMEKLRRFQ